MDEEQISNLKTFWKFLSPVENEKIFSCNYKAKLTGDEIIFSKNHFVSSFDEFLAFSEQFEEKDCYVTGNSFLHRVNRTFGNLKNLSIVGLDIEFTDKEKIETEERVAELIVIVKKHIIEKLTVNNYILTSSGNGVHLFVKIGKPFVISDLIKQSYKKLIKSIEADINFSMTGDDRQIISISDRKEINYVLRIPETTNTKCNRIVKIIEVGKVSKYNSFRKMLLKNRLFLTKHPTKRIVRTTACSSLIPQSFDELNSHPLVESIFDTDLPDVKDWYSSVIFALQSLVKASGLPYDSDMRQLEAEINSLWNMTVSISSCSTDDVVGPLWGAYNFYKQNGFTKYEQELKALLLKNDN